MATDLPVQRAYRAACPQCGAPVEFRSAASAFAVCGYCRSTLARDGDALRRIGQSAELFDDHTPLQLGVRGEWQKEHFSLVGRLQYRYREGTWNEWHALFENGRTAWLSEDNGRYVLVFPVDSPGTLPPPSSLPMESRVMVGGRAWLVASVQRVSLLAAQGELPHAPPAAKADFVVAELRNPQGEVLSLDYSDAAAPQATLGRGVRLAELNLSGLVATAQGQEGGPAERTLRAAGLTCPNCGAGLEVRLDTTQSVVCGQCQAVVDLSKSLGFEPGGLSYYLQENAGQPPQIPLSSVGRLALGGEPLPWQVVGYAERCETATPGGDEQTFWREYLLYHRTEGFAFLVDAEDGWSWTAPITGVPAGGGGQLTWQGVAYRHRFDYGAQVTYVLGEFYWRLQRGEITQNSDFAGTGAQSQRRLNRERTGQGDAAEVVWSAGTTLDTRVLATAFGAAAPGLASAAQAPRSGGPTFPLPGSSSGMKTILFWVVVIVVVLLLVSQCDDDRSSGGGYHGGSYGGFSSGGSHK